MVTTGGRRAAAFWARSDLRQRWRSLVVLGLLVGLTAGFALSAVAGARRTDTALSRLRQQTHASDAVVFPSQVNVGKPDWARLAARPEVAKLAVWDLLFGDVNHQPGGVLFGSVGGTYLGSVDRPVVVKGRMFNPRSSDEVVVDEHAASQAPPIGGTFTFQPYAADQTDFSAPPRGPTVTLHVVGIVRTVPEYLFASDGQVLVSPGFDARYDSRMSVAQNADVVLRHGEADVPALRRDINLVAPGAPVLDVLATSRRVNTTLAVERTSLLLLALAVLFGGGILVALLLGRSAASIGDDSLPLRAFGMTRNQLGLAAGLPHLLSAAVAGLVTFGVALAASEHFPVGLGRRVDPDVGYHMDWAVVLPGVVTAVLAVVGAAVILGRRAHLDRSSAVLRQRPSRLRRGAPVSVGLGTTMAFEPGHGRSRVPVVPALLATVMAVTGIVATLTIDRGITGALAHPERAGVTWDAGVTPDPTAQTARNVTPGLARSIRSDRDVAAASVLDRAVINVGAVGTPTFAVRPLTGAHTTPISFTLISGRAPTAKDEAAIGPATAKDLHVGIGDTVTIGTLRRPVRIVGEALFPSDVHTEFDEGLWITPSRFDGAVPPPSGDATSADERLVAVRFRPGVSLRHGVDDLASALGHQADDVSPPSEPDELVNLANIRALPEVLAAFLGCIAVAALGSVLLSTARRRRHDFAVFRTLGLTRGGVQTVLSAQATAIGLFGLVVGVPLGLAVGRLAWRSIAERVPLSDVAPFALVAVVLIVPVTIVVANLLAIWPGRVILARRPGAEFRSE
jgi:hypothetical protein